VTLAGPYRRPRRPLAPEALAQPYGLPLMCASCKAKNHYFGVLKLPGAKAPVCPNCESELTRARPRLAKP
jgi:hypothetical protein